MPTQSTMRWLLDPREIPIEWYPSIFSAVALAAALTCTTQGYVVMAVCNGLAGLSMGRMMRRTEAAVAQLGEVHHVGNGDPQAAMRAAARWGSDVLGRVARGQAAAEAVAGAALVEMQDERQGPPSEAGSSVSEQELNGFQHNGQANQGSWIHNALRSVTPDGVGPRELARMGTVPEDVPYHGQPLVRRATSPSRLR